jgi:hypothetical protein
MYRKQPYHTLPLLLLIAGAVLSSCAPLIQPVPASGIALTPALTEVEGEVDNPNVFVDPAVFQTALLQALDAHDTENIQLWMTEPFLTGTWRVDRSETSPVDALKSLYSDQLGAEIRLEPVKDADLKALMGGIDPLSIPSSEAGVLYAFLVSGWGKDGRDDAILFVTRQADDNLKWHGWMKVQGGFSGVRFGAIQPYKNDALGFSLYLPKDYEIPTASEVVFLAPGEGHPSEDRASAFIFVEPANGRTAEQVATQLAEKTKAEMGAGYTGAAITIMDIDGEPAYSVNALPGQDINRQLFMVHNDLLYSLMFLPDSSLAAAYSQMEDVYAMIVNTFHFTK